MARFGLIGLCFLFLTACGKYKRQYYKETLVVSDNHVVVNRTIRNPGPHGGELFEYKCKSCHHPTKQVIGPKLQGVRARWSEQTGDPNLIYLFIQNSQAATDSSLFVADLITEDTCSTCPDFELSIDHINAILDYTEYYTQEHAD